MSLDGKWGEFSKNGWPYGQEPSKQDCFKAGYLSALEEIVGKKAKDIIGGSEIDKVRETVAEWQEKFNE